jgi:hypothetical protein
MAKFAGTEASLDAIFLPDGVEVEAHLQGFTIELRAAPIGDAIGWPVS